MTLLVMIVLVVWFWRGIEYLRAVETFLYAKDRATAPAINTSISPRLAEITRRDGYSNINGRTLIRVPDWVVEALGDYYLYFSRHKGDHLRLAFANHSNGPWTIYEAGVLALEDSSFPASDVPQRDPVHALMSTVRDYSISVSRDIVMAICQSLVTSQQQRKAQSVAAGCAPEICVRGPQVMVGHWQRPKATAEAIDSAGWFRTGDIGIRDYDGYVLILDRLKDMAIVSGFNVYPN
jgi:hypothetical protein